MIGVCKLEHYNALGCTARIRLCT